MQGGLKRRLFVLVTLISVAPLLLLSLMADYTTRRSLQASARQNLRALARLQAVHFNQFLREKKQLMKAILSDSKQLAMLVSKLPQKATAKRPPRNTISKQPQTANKMPTSRPSRSLEPSPLRALRRWLEQRREGAKMIGLGLYTASGKLLTSVRKVHTSPSQLPRFKPMTEPQVLGVLHFSGAEETLLRMAAPLPKSGDQQHYLVADFFFSLHQRFLQEKRAPAFQVEIYLLNRKSQVVCGSFDVKHAHHLFGSYKHIPFATTPRQDLWGEVHSYRRAGNGRVFGIALSLQEVGWTLLIELPESQVLAPLFALRKTGSVVLLGFLLLLMLSVAWLAEQMVRPLRELVEATRAFAQGEFQVPLPAASSDEVGELTRAFDKMGQELHTYTHQLEEKVAARTLALEEALEQQKQLMRQLIHQEKMAAIGLLASGVAHEIGNPLASISAMVQRLRYETQDEDMKARYVELEERCDTISRILQTLSDYTRNKPAERVPLNLHHEIEKVIAMLRFDKRLKHVQLTQDIPLNLPLLWAQEDAISQVVTNLLVNALDALEGREDAQIEVRAWPTSHGLRLSICDNGPGLEEDERKRIFDPFYTTKAPGKGTGLGLSICKQIVESLGGSILAKERPEGGTCMEVFLPTHSDAPHK